VVLGYSLKPTPKWTFNFDVEWMDWSAMNKEILDFPDETDTTRQAILTAGNPAPHDWSSAWSFATGFEYKMKDNVRLRSGYYYHTKVGPQDAYHPAIIDNPAHGIATGFGYDINPNLTLDMAYSFIIYQPRKVSTVTASANGTYKEYTNVLMGSLTYKF
jgi:long-chain fatty acid transport protein